MRFLKKHINILLLISILIIFPRCRKINLELLVFESKKAGHWEDRPVGISCMPEFSEYTIENNEFTFNPNHMFCIAINMDTLDFEIMRYESRFGPSILESEGKIAKAVFIEYKYQCDVPFPAEYNWYSADVKIDGISLSNVGIRKKGFWGSIFSEAPAIKINTTKYNQNQIIGKTENITLNNNAEDPTRVVQVLYYKVFELANYPAPRCNLANITINGEPFGVYSHLEAIDLNFLQRQFGNNNGHLYEGQLVDFRTKWLPRWDSKTEYTNQYGTPILDISNVLENSSDQNLVHDLNQYLNVEKFITFWALEIILNHSDGYATKRNNFFIYFNPNDNNRAIFIPWGLNTLDDGYNSYERYVTAELPRRLSRIPETRQMLINELNRIFEEVWKEDELISLIDFFSEQVQTAQIDDSYQEHLNYLKKIIRNRRNNIDIMLKNGLPEGNEKAAKNCCR